MENKNYGNSSLRFSFSDNEQKIAHDFLKKIPRKQTSLIATLICKYLRENNIDPYLYDSEDLNNMVRAYCKASKKANTSPVSYMPTVVIAESDTVKETKKTFSRLEKEKKLSASNQKAESKNSYIEENVSYDESNEFDNDTDMDIDESDISNALASLADFM